MNSRFNTSNIAALGPILTTLLVGLDLKFSWGMGDVWMTAVAALIMWLLTSITPDKGYTYQPEPTNKNLKAFWLVTIIALLLLAPVISGCTLLPQGDLAIKAIDEAIDTGIEDRKHYNDKKAEVLPQLTCDISIGAYYRIQNSVQQEALSMLCSGKRPQEPSPPLGITGTDTAPMNTVTPASSPQS